MSCPLDDWVASLERVHITAKNDQQLHLFDLDSVNHEPYELVAYANTGYALERHYDDASNWSVDQVRLLRMIYRPSQNEIPKFLEDWGGERLLMYRDEALDEEEMKKRESWLCPLDALMQGSSLCTVEPEDLFSITVAIDSTMISWGWGWFATALTKDLAVLSLWNDEMAGLTLLPEPLGLVTREDIFRSAALLFAILENKDYDRFSIEGNFYDEISFSGIDIANMYRLLLAVCGEGGGAVVTMSSGNIVNYRHKSMLYGFEDVARVVEETERMYERYKRQRQ